MNMNVRGNVLTPTQREDLTRLYERVSEYTHSIEFERRDWNISPDGRHAIEVTENHDPWFGQDHYIVEATHLSSPPSSAINPNLTGSKYYHHTGHVGEWYRRSAVSADGKTGWVERLYQGGLNEKWHFDICQIDLDRGTSRPHTALSLDTSTSALASNPLDGSVAFSDGAQVFRYDAKRGLGRTLAHIFNPKQGVTPLATLPSEVHSLGYLRDGSLAILPSDWESRCYILKPGSSELTEVPIETTGPQRIQ